MKRDISKLNNHVLICGYGRLGVSLASDLAEENHPFVVIEVDAASGQQAIDEGYHVVIGDATEEEVLREAGLQSAKSVVTALPSDAANVFITLTARNLNQSVQIIARAEQPSTKRKLEQAGANKIVMPATNSARHMQRMITRPSTAHLIELMSERTYLDLEMDELLVPEESSLVGITVRMTEAHRMHRLLVVAVRRADQSMVFNPEADYTFAVGDVAILMGTRGDIEAFCKRYKLRS